MKIIAEYSLEDLQYELKGIYDLSDCTSISDVMYKCVTSDFSRNKLKLVNGLYLLEISAMAFLVVRFNSTDLCLRVSKESDFYNTDTSISVFYGNFNLFLNKLFKSSTTGLSKDSMFLLVSFYVSHMDYLDEELLKFYKLVNKLQTLPNNISEAVILVLYKNTECLSNLFKVCNILSEVIENEQAPLSIFNKLVGGKL